MLARQRVVWMCIHVVGATACFVLALQRIVFQNQYWTNFSKWPFPNTIEMHLIFFTIKEHLYALWSAKKNKSAMHFKGNCQSFTIHIGEGVLIMDHNKRFFFPFTLCVPDPLNPLLSYWYKCFTLTDGLNYRKCSLSIFKYTFFIYSWSCLKP